ncbi:MAG: hypothetical protein II887_05855 [Bacteroidales bacterium]|nr:hypothetical protein [Bacteroidales bacterium]
MTAPTEKQIRMMHVVNLISIAYSDGTIAEKESSLIQNIAQKWGLEEEDFNNCVEYWKSKDEIEIPIAVPNNEDEEVEFLKDFTLLMMIDGTIEESEKIFLRRVANEFGYDADKVVPQLIDLVYDEYFADSNDENSDEEDEDNEEEEDDLFEDTYDESQINMGKIELQGKQLEKAFDELFLPALRNAEALACFHSIPGIDTRLFRITPEQLELIQKAADKGYAVAHYVLGRYHQVVKPEEESIEKALQYLESAANAGIPDAQWALAIDYLYGYQGPVEMDEFNKRIDQAIDNGSMMALKQRLYDIIHGLHGQKADPKTIIKQIEAFLAQDEENALKYPYMYDLLGDAYRRIGNKDKADESYEKAVDNGLFEADAHRFENRVDGPDKDFYRQTFSFLLDFSCDNKAPRSFMLRGLENAFLYEQDEDEDLTEKIKSDLETACELGEGDAAYYLGKYYYEGSHGFEKDDDEAWDWFYKGEALESGLAFKGMIKMIEDGYIPEGMPEDYLETLRLHASYRCNEAEAETAIPTMIIVNAKGEATVYKVEKTEWFKLRHITGARRIFPIRLDALDKLGKKAGLTDHLVAWTDIDGPRKSLTENNILSKLYKGIVAGDVVFSQAGKLYDPMPFYGVEEAEAVIKALGAKLTNVVTDISQYSDERNEPIDVNMVNPFVRKGYIARIEPDGKAHLLNSSLDVFAMFEDDIYDPARLPSLYDLGKSIGLKDRLTIWTDNMALSKQLNWKNDIDQNPIGAKWCPFLVADNIFVALEDENYRMKLFEDLETLKKTCIALGVKPENLIVE